MKIKMEVEVELSEFFEPFGDDSLAGVIRNEIKEQMLDKLRCDPVFNAKLKDKHGHILNSLFKD